MTDEPSITDRRDEQLRAITQALPAALSISNNAGRVLWVNPFWTQFTGLSLEESLGDGWRRAVHPDDMPALVDAFRAARDSGGPYDAEVRFRNGQGHWIWIAVHGEPLRGDDGRIGGWIAVSTDIDARKRAEDEVRLRQARYEALIGATATVVYELAAEGGLKHANATWTAFSGMSWEETKAGGWLRTVHPDDRAQAEADWRAAVAARRASVTDLRHWHAPTESWRWMRAHTVPLFDKDGAITEWIGALTDIHDQKLAAETQQILVLELQHRVQNGLAVVRALTDQTFRGSDSLPAFMERFEGRLEALSHAQSLLTRSAAYVAELGELAREVLEPFGVGSTIRLAGPAVTVGSTTAANLALALHELATNAAKYGALSIAGGHVDLTWALAGDIVEMRWVERDGPPVAEPVRKGFGSRLLSGALNHEPGGRTRLEFAPEGLRCEMRWRRAA